MIKDVQHLFPPNHLVINLVYASMIFTILVKNIFRIW